MLEVFYEWTTANPHFQILIHFYYLETQINNFLGLGHHIGALTAKSILDTFSNNDYVNIMNYTDKTNYIVPCFEDMLVQATKENIQLFGEALDSLKPEGKTQLGQALEVAFKLLAKVCLSVYSFCTWKRYS